MSRVDSASAAHRKSIDAAKAASSALTPKFSWPPPTPSSPSPMVCGSTGRGRRHRGDQPGGSMRDDEVIAAADEAGLAMVMTGVRHFRH
ncbi:MAG: hypothetical protein NVV72_11245 [Asticcacaulis sp.]|nr:hypothetical protein [Asticcacaulis sp.]